MEGIKRNLTFFSEADLKSLALVDKEIRPYALKQLVLNKFGTVFWEDKEPNLSEEEWYLFLYKIDDINKMNISTANKAIRTNNIIFLNFLQKRNILPSMEGLLSAFKLGHTDVLEWILQNRMLMLKEEFQFTDFQYKLDPTTMERIVITLSDLYVILCKLYLRIYGMGSRKEHNLRLLKVLEWFEYKGVKFNDALANVIHGLLSHKDIIILEWLAQRKILPKSYQADAMIYEKKFKMLNWLLEKGVLPTLDGANEASRIKNFEILEKLAEKNILPNSSAVDFAIEKRNWEMFEWLKNHNIWPTSKGANFAAGQGNWKLLEWLEKKEILPTFEGANFAAEQGNLELLEWLEDRDIWPTSKGANFAAEQGNWELLEWLEDRNILPDSAGADLAAEKGRLSVLKWLEEKEIYPTEEGGRIGVILAQRNEYWELLEWLVERGYYPN